MPAVLFLPARRSSLSARLTGMAWAAAVSTVLSLGARPVEAAPVTGSQAEAAEPVAAARPAGAAPTPTTGAGARPDVSTGNRNLDLLLEMQGRAGEAGLAASQPHSRPSGLAKLAVPQPNTNLSGGVMNEARVQGAKPAAQNAELLGDLGAGMPARPSADDPTARREWVGPAGGSRSGNGLGGLESRPRGGPVDEPAALRTLREVIEWMREHRWQVLGSLLGIAALAGLLKAYSRRPER